MNRKKRIVRFNFFGKKAKQKRKVAKKLLDESIAIAHNDAGRIVIFSNERYSHDWIHGIVFDDFEDKKVVLSENTLVGDLYFSTVYERVLNQEYQHFLQIIDEYVNS